MLFGSGRPQRLPSSLAHPVGQLASPRAPSLPCSIFKAAFFSFFLRVCLPGNAFAGLAWPGQAASPRLYQSVWSGVEQDAHIRRVHSPPLRSGPKQNLPSPLPFRPCLTRTLFSSLPLFSRTRRLLLPPSLCFASSLLGLDSARTRNSAEKIEEKERPLPKGFSPRK